MQISAPKRPQGVPPQAARWRRVNVRAAMACALSASVSNEAGISAATTPLLAALRHRSAVVFIAQRYSSSGMERTQSFSSSYTAITAEMSSGIGIGSSVSCPAIAHPRSSSTKKLSANAASPSGSGCRRSGKADGAARLRTRRVEGRYSMLPSLCRKIAFHAFASGIIALVHV